MNRFFFSILLLIWKNSGLLFFFYTSLVYCEEVSEIPKILHWIRMERSPLTKEEIKNIESWKRIHPKWSFKLWTNAPCTLSKVQVRSIDPSLSKLSEIKESVLSEYGGIFIDLNLLGCKPLDEIVSKGIPFQTEDDTSVVGCPPHRYLEPRVTLPGNFIFPRDVFTTKTFISPTDGVCFWKFSSFSGLTDEMEKIQTDEVRAILKNKKLDRKLLYLSFLIIAIGVLGRLNLYLYRAYFPHFFSLVFILKGVLVVGGIGFFVFYPYKEVLKQENPVDINDFASLSNLSAYDPYIFEKDRELLTNYSKNFTNFFLLQDLKVEELIPTTIHLIWGGKEFPKSSIANVLSWMKFHPNWTFKFWTDDPDRFPPVENMEKHLFDEILSTSSLRSYFEKGTNWGEKSDLLRMEILFREGGLYIDHDIEWFSSFEPLHHKTTFYTCLEPIHKSPLFDSHLTTSNCLIGVKPHHPIIEKAISITKERWSLGEKMFPDEDQMSVLLRTLYRTFAPFDEAVRLLINSSEQAVVLPPPMVFIRNSPNHYEGILQEASYPYANHQWKNTWFKEIDEASSLIHSDLDYQTVCTLFNLLKKLAICLVGSLMVLGFIRLNKIRGRFICLSICSFFSLRQKWWPLR